jgi:hypothetical protein
VNTITREIGRVFAVVLICTAGGLRAEDIRINLDDRNDSRVNPKIDAAGFSIYAEASGYLQKLEPTTIRIETQQKGQWVDPQLEAGRYLKTDFDAEKPQLIHIETTLRFDLAAGEQRFSKEREWIQREVEKRTGGKDGGAKIKARTQLLLERIDAIRKENIEAGADKRGKGTLHSPPLPRVALNYEKPDALERLLKEQCYWQPVAEVFKATQFQPPESDDRDHPDFAASAVMADEIRQAMMGIKFAPRHLSDSQYKALEQGSHYSFTAQFIPEIPGSTVDMLWKNAPAVRLADGVVKRATLEGSLDRARGQTVAWWRVECDTPNRMQPPQMAKGDGDCFWTWVETPDEHVRYLRMLLHSPGTRYRMNLGLIGSAKGEEVTLYDGPLNAPAKAPF